MTQSNRLVWTALLVVAVVCVPASAAAQSPADSRWSADVAVGWDNALSGDVLAAGIGTLNGVPVAIQSQSYDDVYGTGVLLLLGGGYLLDERNEVRGQFTYQRVGADLVELGLAGSSTLVATFADYQAYSLEAGYRRYFADRTERLRPYAGGTIGVAVVSEIDAALAAPEAGLTRYATDFYDGTAAFTLGVNGGVLWALTDRVDLNGQLGFRFLSSLTQIDGLVGSGLEETNDKSARWTLPIVLGVRFKF